MSTAEFMTSLFSEIWKFFSVDHPILGISFADIFLGVLVVNVSIVILRPLLGLGVSAGRSLIKAPKTWKDRDP